ncbi:MAG: fructose 1,6-bisphosphatase [Candidatus Omnitrophota bacterium]|nr:fructose 1,6-bisphosphatase [Candidatus Omnitrophota bacterium]
MFKRLLGKGIALAVVSMVAVGIVMFNGLTAGFASPKADSVNGVDTLRTQSLTERTDDVAKMFSSGFISAPGKVLAHDKIFKVKAAKAFVEGRAVEIFGHNAVNDLDKSASEFIAKSGEIDINQDEIVQKLTSTRSFLNDQIFTDEFINRVVYEISKIDENDGKEVQKDKKNAMIFLNRVKAIAAIKNADERIKKARETLINDTRFVVFLFGEKGLDPYLFNVGNILSNEHRVLFAHTGTYAYAGSEAIEGGARTIYSSLARINGFKNEGAQGVELYQEMMLHEFMDMARGKHIDTSAEITAKLNVINTKIDDSYNNVVIEVTESGPVLVTNDKVKIEKFRLVDDLGRKDTFAIKGSSKIHPGVPKGELLTITVAKADVGSIGGHGTAPGMMLEAVAEIWMKAAERGEIVDFFITRVGDDISVTITHNKGKDNEYIHENIWNGFVQGAVVAKDHGFYGAGQDLLADAFSGNVRGAGPSVAEMVIREQKAEVMIFAQADKTAPGAFNKGLWDIFFGTNTTWRPLGSGNSKRVEAGMLDFDFNNSAGRHINFTSADYDEAAWFGGIPDRYTYDNITIDKEDVAAVTAQRLGKIAGEYVGKDDPMMMIRSQKKYPAVGEITSPFLKGEYFVPGWMRGSNKGPFFPVSLKDARIGIYDGPPLISMWSFNLNNGRLEGFYDLFAANPAIRYIQDRRAAAAVRQLEEGFGEMALRLGEQEIEYQEGPKTIEKRLAGRWENYVSEDNVEIEKQKIIDAKFTEIGKIISEKKGKAVLDLANELTWGANLAPIAKSFPLDINFGVSAKVAEINNVKQIEGEPAAQIILLEHETLLKESPAGIMALQNIREQIGRGAIKIVLHINRDDLKPEEIEKIVDADLEKIVKINGGFGEINRNTFDAVVVGTNLGRISNELGLKFNSSIDQVIGSEEYVNQFKDGTVKRIVIDQANKEAGTSTAISVAKALRLSLELILADKENKVVSSEEVNKLDNLFSKDAAGNFHVKAGQSVGEVETIVDNYKTALEKAVISI